MESKVKYKKIDTTPITSTLSKINNVIGNVKNVSFEVFFDDIKIYEVDNVIFSILSARDGTGNISVLIVGNRDEETQKLIKSITIKDKYRIKGNTTTDIDLVYKELDELTENKIDKKILKNKILFVKTINKVEHRKKV